MSGLDRRLASVSAMQKAAARRIPEFARIYLEGGIGQEDCLARNRAALDAIQLTPRYITEAPFTPDLRTTLFGKTWPAPFAPGPVGLTGLIWPKCPEITAQAAAEAGLPFALSSFSTASIEDIAPIAGEKLWFQMYCPKQSEIEESLLARAEAAGCGALMITIDIPTTTRRERETAAGVSVPPVLDWRTVLQAAARPAWALAMLRAGTPGFRTLEQYAPQGAPLHERAAFLADMVDTHVTQKTLARIRKRWTRPLIVKGVLSEDDARICRDAGVDAVVVSNHGGRQLDAAPSAPEALPRIRAVMGDKTPVIADGGVRSGLDILRLIAAGADFVFLGRAPAYAVAAAGLPGARRLIELLNEELRQTCAQLGCKTPAEARGRLG